MLGEIDCREGLLLAVDKLKYDTMEQAMAVLIGLYVRVLLCLIAQRRFEVFVHPVPPVLDETRHVVQPFNRALQREVGQDFRCGFSATCPTRCRSRAQFRASASAGRGIALRRSQSLRLCCCSNDAGALCCLCVLHSIHACAAVLPTCPTTGLCIIHAGGHASYWSGLTM